MNRVAQPASNSVLVPPTTQGGFRSPEAVLDQRSCCGTHIAPHVGGKLYDAVMNPQMLSPASQQKFNNVLAGDATLMELIAICVTAGKGVHPQVMTGLSECQPFYNQLLLLYQIVCEDLEHGVRNNTDELRHIVHETSALSPVGISGMAYFMMKHPESISPGDFDKVRAAVNEYPVVRRYIEDCVKLGEGLGAPTVGLSESDYKKILGTMAFLQRFSSDPGLWKWKTKLCINKACSWNKCFYAHGVRDLRVNHMWIGFPENIFLGGMLYAIASKMNTKYRNVHDRTVATARCRDQDLDTIIGECLRSGSMISPMYVKGQHNPLLFEKLSELAKQVALELELEDIDEHQAKRPRLEGLVRR